MALLDTYNLANSAEFRARVSAALAKAAYDITNESGSTTNHAERLVWAKATLKAPDPACDQMIWMVMQNATIQSSGLSSTDNDIQFVVNSNIDLLAV